MYAVILQKVMTVANYLVIEVISSILNGNRDSVFSIQLQMLS